MTDVIASIYARKSTEQAGVANEAKSVHRQIEHARAYAARKGWTVDEAHVYVDDGISGAEFARRPGFLRLMNALKPRPPFQALVMSEESRLGREAIETAYALKQLVAAGVRVFFYLEDRERTLDSPTDKIMLSLTAFADELEREKARQRTYDALLRKARAGHVTGGRTFGYDNVEIRLADGSRSHVERRVNEAEAAIVRRIFELSAAGQGMKAIAKQLNAAGAVSPRAQRGRSQTWAPSSVREVLFRDLYRGVVTWNRTRKRNHWGVQHQMARPEGDWLERPAPELAIVSEEAWSATHARLEAVRGIYLKGTGGRAFGRPALGDPSKYLLTNLALCGCCGGSLHVRSQRHGTGRRHFYACSGYHLRGRTVCTNKADVPMTETDALVLEALLDDVLDPTIVRDAVERALELVLVEASAEPSSGEVEAEIAAADQERQRLGALIAAGDALDAVSRALKALQAREARIASLKAGRTDRRAEERRGGPDAARVRRDLLALAAQWRQVLQRQPAEARPIVTLLLDGRITITPTGEKKQWELQGTATLTGLFSRSIFQSDWRPHGALYLLPPGAAWDAWPRV